MKCKGCKETIGPNEVYGKVVSEGAPPEGRGVFHMTCLKKIEKLIEAELVRRGHWPSLPTKGNA